MMKKLALAALLMGTATPMAGAADFDSCSAVRLAASAIKIKVDDLKTDYPFTLAILAKGMEEAGKASTTGDTVLIGVGTLLTCAAVIDTETCDHVAGELTGAITGAALVCAASASMNCGVCQ